MIYLLSIEGAYNSGKLNLLYFKQAIEEKVNIYL